MSSHGSILSLAFRILAENCSTVQLRFRSQLPVCRLIGHVSGYLVNQDLSGLSVVNCPSGSVVEMKSQELYSTLREHLAPLFKASGFKRTTTMLSWIRPHGALYEGAWCQADQRGWDSYAGSKFVVEFQLGPEPVIGSKAICRRRIGELLSPAEREEA